MANNDVKKTFVIGNDITVNRMGYGAMRITGQGIWGLPKDKAEAIRVLKRAVELGVNFIDTADSYGPHVSEELIAEALYPYPKDLLIATKGGLMRSGPNAWAPNADPNYLRGALEGSLKRLKLERIDLYQLHRIDPKVPFEKSLEFLRKAQEEGLIKHIGLSEVSVADIETAKKYINVVSIQNRYSIDERKWEKELQYAREHNMAFIPWYPLSSGNLAGQEKLQKVADRHHTSVNQVALSWLFHHSPNILLIPGTSQVKHLEENVKAPELILTGEDMKTLGQ